VGPAHPVLDARDFAELVCAVRAEIPCLCVCLCDRLVRRGGGDGQRTAARREYLLFPVGVRTRLLHLPAQHREYRVLGRWTILLANPRCRNMFLLVDGRVTRCAAGHGARCRRAAACSRTRPAMLRPLPLGSPVLACASRAGFMGELVPPNRKALAVYPLFLFYTAIGWLILIAAKRS
jgi:hypothetical protein